MNVPLLPHHNHAGSGKTNTHAHTQPRLTHLTLHSIIVGNNDNNK